MNFIHVELSNDQASTLAHFVKRVGWSEMRANAVDDAEADEIRSALEQLRRALAEAGFSPR